VGIKIEILGVLGPSRAKVVLRARAGSINKLIKVEASYQLPFKILTHFQLILRDLQMRRGYIRILVELVNKTVKMKKLRFRVYLERAMTLTHRHRFS
jgi:hypothetical protein